MAYDKPLPQIDPSSEPFWSAAKERRLSLPRCLDCGRHHFYPRELCPHCYSDQLEWADSKGEGEVYTFTIARRPAGAGFKGETPYVVAIVALDEGPRMLSNIVGADPADVRIGARVRVRFDDVTDEVTLPKFELAE